MAQGEDTKGSESDFITLPLQTEGEPYGTQDTIN